MIRLSSFIGLFLLFFYILLIVLGVQKYLIWSQITDLIDGLTHTERWELIFELIDSSHPHALRIFLVNIIYDMADLLPLSLEKVFSIVVILCIYFTYKINAYIGAKSFVSNMLVLFFFFILVLLMNGRIAFAIFGNTLILYALFKRHYVGESSFLIFFFYILLGVLFCSVSSGTTFVAIGFILCFYLIQLLLYFPKINTKIVLYFTLFIALLLFGIKDILLVYFYKNLAYYDGSLYNMLSHGVGKYLTSYYLIILPFLLVIVVFVWRYFKKYPLLILPGSLVVSAVFIGLFGLSSLVSGVSGFMLLLLIYVKTNNTEQSYS